MRWDAVSPDSSPSHWWDLIWLAIASHGPNCTSALLLLYNVLILNSSERRLRTLSATVINL